MSNPLANYAKEIGVTYITLEELIASHRGLRSQNQKRNEEIRAEAARVIEQLVGPYKNAQFISHEELRDMTLREIKELLFTAPPESITT